ncbi:hypothetical protein ACUIHB_10800 [Aeromonas veronii]|uniref:hypothetical protein n=1 Tax=Aeromonas veronii TaxID=654 RepID=UPI00124A8439
MPENESRITFQQPTPESSQTSEPVQVTNRPLVGKIARQIGTGQNAKDSFIWMTITWSFVISSATSGLFLLYALIVSNQEIDVLESVRSIWSIFTPIITLALGYAFGKGQ